MGKRPERMGLCLLTAVLACGLWTAGLAAGGDGPSSCDYRVYGLDAAKFFVYLTRDTPYTAWPLWPGSERAKPARGPGGPHGPHLTTYVNPVAHLSLAKGEPMAFGSLIVNESRDPDARVKNIAVRIRLKGYNPEAGDWYWFMFTPEGTVREEGKVAACLGCHGNMKDRDYVMTGASR